MPSPQAAPWASAPDWMPPDVPAQGGGGPSDVSYDSAGRPVITVRPKAKTPWDDAPDWTPPAPQAPAQQIGAGQAAVRGGIDAGTFGLAPAIVGLNAAGGAGKTQEQIDQIQPPGVASEAPGLEMGGEGLARVLADKFGNHPDPVAREAYERGRKAALEDQETARQQHPGAYIAGQIVGTTALTPSFGVARGVTMAGKAAHAALAGGLANLLYSAGSDVSEGVPAGQIPADAAKGGLTGAALGTLGSGAVSALGKVGNKVGSLVRGTRDVDAEAGRRVVGALRSDIDAHGLAMSPEEIAAADAAGTPRAIVDAGGERTRALARSSANTSPEARQALTEMTGARFENQSPRIAGFIRNMTGGGNAADDANLIARAGQIINKPAYAKAYTAGDRPIWSPELERLTGSPAVSEALGAAARRGKDRAVADGMGGFRPSATVTPDGRVTFNKGPKGVPTYPNLQFWDYTQRELRDAASAAQRAGRNEEAGALKSLRRQLRDALDKQVPEFKAARDTAASFFGAEDALEAGQKFVMSNSSLPEARRALSKMTPAERELFARGFASDLADRIERTGDRRNVLNSIFLGSNAARQKIVVALGPQRAAQLEALLRVETIVDEARKTLGNSTTARQLGEMGMAGGAVAAFEMVKEHDLNPAHVIAGALTFGALRHGAKKIDENVARRVGEMLASNDPSVLSKGIKIASSSTSIMDALRRVTAGSTRVGSQDVGPVNAAAGAVAAGQYLGESFGAGHDK